MPRQQQLLHDFDAAKGKPITNSNEIHEIPATLCRT